MSSAGDAASIAPSTAVGTGVMLGSGDIDGEGETATGAAVARAAVERLAVVLSGAGASVGATLAGAAHDGASSRLVPSSVVYVTWELPHD